MEKVETKVLDSMYHRIQNYNLPCKAKPSFESISCKQLLACDVVSEDTRTDDDQFSIALKKLKNEQARLNGSSDNSGSRECFAPFALSVIIDRLNPHGTNDNQQEISGWSSCPSTYSNQVQQHAQHHVTCKSATHLATLYHYSDVAKTGSTAARSQSAGSTSKKSRTSKGSSTSCCRTSEEGIWSEPPPPMPIHYIFKHYKYPRQYVIQYREKYTYKKLKERLSLIKHFVTSGGGAIPKAHLVCIDSRQGVRGVTLGGKSECERIVEGFEQAIQDKKGGKDSNQKWNLFAHLNDRCDPTLTVNNPSPTEIATFAKMPTVRRSSPSIPSNSNGRFGFRGTPDSHYPFQLNISVGSCTIATPTKKSTRRGVITH